MNKSNVRQSFTAVLLVLAMIMALIPMVQSVSPDVSAAGEVVASVDFSNGATSGTNLSLHVADYVDAKTESANIGGSQCRYIPSGNYAYFKTARAAVPTSQKNMFIEVTYYDNSTNGLMLQYNAVSGNYRNAEIGRTNSGKWSTVKYIITDAAFNGKQNNGADFRISGVAYIKSVKITFDTVDLGSSDLGKRTGGSSYSEFTGKTVAGYQAWFGTGGQNEGWTHWGNGQNKWPMLGNSSFAYYPTVDEYDQSLLAQTGFANLGNGQPAKLFNSQEQNSIDTQVGWMKDYGIDGAALQRFSPSISGRAIVDPTNHLYTKVKKAAEANDRIFYIMYDISGGDAATYVDDMKFDWIYNVEQGCELLNSDSYATVDGKPVVCIWGMGVPERVTTGYDELVNFFKSRDCYVILGVNDDWRTQSYINTFKKADMISPWYVGRFGDEAGVDSFYANKTQADVNYCKQNGLDYYPVIFSGFSWATWNNGKPNMIPRNSGNFIWYQAYKLKQMGINSYYVAMFDEYDEGTAIMKSASDYFDIPTDAYFITNSADGYWLSNDFQLRTVGNIAKMGKGELTATKTNPTAASEGPIYYRNSFESRYAECVDTQYSGNYPIDPCFHNPTELKASGVSGQSTTIIKSNKAKTGEYTARIAGTAGANSEYSYKISDASIKVTNGMTLRFDKCAVNAGGNNVGVRVVFSDGSSADSDLTESAIGSWANLTFVIGKGGNVGKTVTQIALYEKSTAAGGFEAYIDNIIIEDGEDVEDDPCDLTVSEVNCVEDSVSAGDSVGFYGTIRNASNVLAEGNIDVSVFVDGIPCDQHSIEISVDAGGNINFTTKSDWKAVVGTHTLAVVVNNSKKVEETNLKNNILKQKISVNA